MLKTAVNMGEAAVLFKILGDKTRLTMVKILDSQECCVCELVAVFNMSQPAVSQHLRKLRDNGLVNESRKGQWIFYSLNKESSLYPFIQDIMNHLPSQDHLVEELEKKGTRISCD